MSEVQPAVPAITALLRSKGHNTIGHETNLSRSPLWRARKQSAPDETVVSPMLYGHAFRQVEGHPLTTGDQRLFAHLTTAYVRAGCPSDRRVPFSLGGATGALGHQESGGRQRSLVRKSLARLRSVTIESAVRHPDGHETVLGWGLIDSYLITTKGGGKGWIVLSEPVSLLLAEGSVTFLHEPTWKAICGDDEVAGRLWSFLESENVKREWRYPIFPSIDGATTSSVPAICDVLMLHWTLRRKVAQRVGEACAVVMAHDKRYHLEVVPAKTPGAWNLVCSCSPRRTPEKADHGLPRTVIQAWRKAYRSQLPSLHQRTVLAELLTRHSSDWIVETLAEQVEGDPFRHLMVQDRGISKVRLAAAREAEEAWEGEKHREAAEAEQSLADLIAEIKGRASTV